MPPRFTKVTTLEGGEGAIKIQKRLCPRCGVAALHYREGSKRERDIGRKSVKHCHGARPTRSGRPRLKLVGKRVKKRLGRKPKKEKKGPRTTKCFPTRIGRRPPDSDVGGESKEKGYSCFDSRQEKIEPDPEGKSSREAKKRQGRRCKKSSKPARFPSLEETWHLPRLNREKKNRHRRQPPTSTVTCTFIETKIGALLKKGRTEIRTASKGLL